MLDPDADLNAQPHLDEMDRLVTLGYLSGGIAHEINNALTSMRLSLGRLVSFEVSRRPKTPEGEHRVELIQDLREGVERIERIVRELKAFSHVEDEPVRPLDVRAELDSVLVLLAHEIRHRAVLASDLKPVPTVLARATSLRQVFVNLLLNAIQAIPDGGAHVNEIRASTRTDADGRAVIEICDTGAGISPAHARRIFEPFFTTSPTQALGLGLAIARNVVAALDGDIMIDSLEGVGTTVRVVLPAHTGASDAVDDELIDERVLMAPMLTKRRRIMIVDDDRRVAAAIALELDGHDVVVAENGREALQLLRRDESYDVLLCDLMMPEVTGMDVYNALSTFAPALLKRMVMMTGGAFTAQARQFVAEVNAPLIEKPFRTGELLVLVETIARMHEGAAEPRVARRDSI